jgi:hypothetical protein
MNKKESAKMLITMFNNGAIMMASLHLGFDITVPLTVKQAGEFHEFIKPLLVRACWRTKDNKEKTDELEAIYNSTTPNELLEYLLKEEMVSDGDLVFN